MIFFKYSFMALMIVSLAGFIIYKHFSFDIIPANSMSSSDIMNNILSISFLTGFGTFTIETMFETIKNICTKIKLKFIKKEIKNWKD